MTNNMEQGLNKMEVKELKNNIYSVGAIDWKRRLFDELIPLPDGTSYNSYLIKGSSKVALIDTVDVSMSDVLLNNLKELKIKNINYIISNHAEQDHSGSISDVLKNYPTAKVVTNSKCKHMLVDLLQLPDEKFITISEGDSILLGDKTLEFIFAPWVHWPETMFTYLKEDKVLFTCDFLGSHFATDELFVKNEKKIYNAAKRYYAEIMMPFKTSVKRNLEKIKDLEIEIIAASHGPIYNRPKFILDAYKDWSSDEVKNKVVIPYISMHGSTAKIVDYLSGALTKKGITVESFNLTITDIGELAMALVDAATVIAASPTVLTGAHPNVLYAAYLLKVLKPKLRFISVVGSYGWGGKMVEQLKETLASLRAEIIEPVIIKGYPKDQDLKLLKKLAEEIYRKHDEINIVKD